MKMQNVNSLGAVIKIDNNTPIKQRLDSSIEARIIEDQTIPNSAGNPTLKAYLEAEAEDGFTLDYISPTMIVTTMAAIASPSMTFADAMALLTDLVTAIDFTDVTKMRDGADEPAVANGEVANIQNQAVPNDEHVYNNGPYPVFSVTPGNAASVRKADPPDGGFTAQARGTFLPFQLIGAVEVFTVNTGVVFQIDDGFIQFRHQVTGWQCTVNIEGTNLSVLIPAVNVPILGKHTFVLRCFVDSGQLHLSMDVDGVQVGCGLLYSPAEEGEAPYWSYGAKDVTGSTTLPSDCSFHQWWFVGNSLDDPSAIVAQMRTNLGL